MIITIDGDSDNIVTLAAEKAKELLSDLNAEIKTVADLPNYRRNRQLFGGGDDFDRWIITNAKTDENFYNNFKGIKIVLNDGPWNENSLKSYIKDILVKEKFIYA